MDVKKAQVLLTTTNPHYSRTVALEPLETRRQIRVRHLGTGIHQHRTLGRGRSTIHVTHIEDLEQVNGWLLFGSGRRL